MVVLFFFLLSWTGFWQPRRGYANQDFLIVPVTDLQLLEQLKSPDWRIRAEAAR